MTSRDRFQNILNFDMRVDRLPMVEWAAWWDLTVNRWRVEGLPELDYLQLQNHFGLDPMVTIGTSPSGYELYGTEFQNGPIVNPNREYDTIKKYLYTDTLIDDAVTQAKNLKQFHDNGDIIIRASILGFFWFPRTLFGIEQHLYSFYDEPELNLLFESWKQSLPF